MTETGLSGWEFPDNINTTGIVDALETADAFKGYNNVNQSIPNNTWTDLGMDTTRWDPSSMHSTTVNNHIVTIATSGYYAINYQAIAHHSRQDWRLAVIQIYVAGVLRDRGMRHLATGWPQGHWQALSGSCYTFLSATNQVKIRMFQRNTASAASNWRGFLALARMSGAAHLSNFGDPT